MTKRVKQSSTQFINNYIYGVNIMSHRQTYRLMDKATDIETLAKTRLSSVELKDVKITDWKSFENTVTSNSTEYTRLVSEEVKDGSRASDRTVELLKQNIFQYETIISVAEEKNLQSIRRNERMEFHRAEVNTRKDVVRALRPGENIFPSDEPTKKKKGGWRETARIGKDVENEIESKKLGIKRTDNTNLYLNNKLGTSFGKGPDKLKQAQQQAEDTAQTLLPHMIEIVRKESDKTDKKAEEIEALIDSNPFERSNDSDEEDNKCCKWLRGPKRR